MKNIYLIFFSIIFICACSNNTETTKIEISKECKVEESVDSLKIIIDSLKSIIKEYQEESYIRLPTEDEESFLFNSKYGGDVWGITKLKGYYLQKEFQDLGVDEMTVCDCFVILDAPKIYKNSIIELINSKNSLHFLDKHGNPGIKIDTSDLRDEELILLNNSSIEKPIYLSVYIRHPIGTEVHACYSTVNILRISKK
jgi:hypothetical protein